MSRKGLVSAENRKNFSLRLKSMRMKKNISVMDMVDKISTYDTNIEPCTYYRYEEGESSPSKPAVLKAMAEILDVSEAYLKCETDFIHHYDEENAKALLKDYYKEKKDPKIYSIRNSLPFITNLTRFLSSDNKYITFEEVYKTQSATFYYRIKEYKAVISTHEPFELTIQMFENEEYISQMIEKTKQVSTGLYRDKISEAHSPLLTPDGNLNINAELVATDTNNISEDIFLQYLSEAESVNHFIEICEIEDGIEGLELIGAYRIPFAEFVSQSQLFMDVYLNMLVAYNKRFQVI